MGRDEPGGADGVGPVGATAALAATDAGRLYAIDEILAAVWSGSRRATASGVHQSVYALRREIETDPRNPRFVATVPPMGYKLGQI